jgi:hypothetical protein
MRLFSELAVLVAQPVPLKGESPVRRRVGAATLMPLVETIRLRRGVPYLRQGWKPDGGESAASPYTTAPPRQGETLTSSTLTFRWP